MAAIARSRILSSCAGALLLPSKLVWSHIPSCTRGVNLWEREGRGDYKSNDELTNLEHIKNGLKILRNDIGLFKRQLKEMILVDEHILMGHGDYQYFAKFHDNQTLNSWIVTTDSDNMEGKSHAYFELNKNLKGVFHGYLNQEVPKDGKLKKAGYCNIKSPKNMKAFNQEEPYDWTGFTHLYLRIRGDGRVYLLTISMEHYFDILWNDAYHYPLFTRGGPYWQIVKIPLSKFYLTQKGRVQDKQEPMARNGVKTLGITAGDDVLGPFKLELDYIALVRDESHTEEFAYELYETKKHQAGV